MKDVCRSSTGKAPWQIPKDRNAKPQNRELQQQDTVLSAGVILCRELIKSCLNHNTFHSEAV